MLISAQVIENMGSPTISTSKGEHRQLVRRTHQLLIWKSTTKMTVKSAKGVLRPFLYKMYINLLFPASERLIFQSQECDCEANGSAFNHVRSCLFQATKGTLIN